MRIECRDDTLVLTSTDPIPWFGVRSLMLLIIPICSAFFVSHVYSAFAKDWKIGWLVAAFMAFMVISLVRDLLGACHSTVVVDTRFRQVDIERRFIHRSEHEKLRFAEIAALEIAESTDSDGQPHFQPVLLLNSGRKLVLGPKLQSREALDQAIAAFDKSRA